MLRHHHIQGDEVRLAFFQVGDAVFGVASDHYLVPLGFKKSLEEKLRTAASGLVEKQQQADKLQSKLKAQEAVSVMKKMKRYEMLSEKTGDSKYDDKIYDLLDDFTVATSNLMMAAMKKGAVRVRQHSELSDFVSIQGEGLTLDRFRKLVQSQKIPFGRHLKYEIEGLEGEDKHHIYSVEAKWSVLSDAKSWPEVKRRMTAKDRAFNAGPENKS